MMRRRGTEEVQEDEGEGGGWRFSGSETATQALKKNLEVFLRSSLSDWAPSQGVEGVKESGRKEEEEEVVVQADLKTTRVEDDDDDDAP